MAKQLKQYTRESDINVGDAGAARGYSGAPTMPMLTYAADELPVRATSDTCDMYLVRRDSSASLLRNKSTVSVPVWRFCFVRLRIATRQAGRRPSRLLMRSTTPLRILEPPKPVRQSISTAHSPSMHSQALVGYSLGRPNLGEATCVGER
jgi:hypothetical protein